MILKELLKLLNNIKKVHPEAADADVCAHPDPDSDGRIMHITYVRFDKRHKPARIVLED